MKPVSGNELSIMIYYSLIYTDKYSLLVLMSSSIKCSAVALALVLAIFGTWIRSKIT